MKNKIVLNIFDENNNLLGEKAFYSSSFLSLQKWWTEFKSNKEENIALMVSVPPMFQTNQMLAILSKAQKRYCLKITQENIIPFFIYFSVRHTIPATWINDRDQFLFPNKNWEKDKEFQHNCFVYALFHGQNRISSREGTNHLIPFTEKELNIKEAFESHFLLDFMAGKIKSTEKDILGENKESFIPTKPMEFSIEAHNVLNAAKALYIYYHQMAGDVGTAWKINDKIEYLPNAALYDIKEFFQGRNEKGRMNSKSEDLKYTELLNDLKNTQKILAQKIEPKIYEYEFLLE